MMVAAPAAGPAEAEAVAAADRTACSCGSEGGGGIRGTDA